MITRLEELPSIRRKHSSENIALTGGVFDLMHPGHIALFKYMSSIADIGVVALSSDKRVKQRKGSTRPIQNEGIRLTMVDAVRYVDYALIAPEPNENEVPTVRIMRELSPDIFLTSDESWLAYRGLFREIGARLLLVPRFNEGIDTTSTIERVLQTHRDASPSLASQVTGHEPNLTNERL
jgi:D-beta-D-heptose 7-phosphate kinase/D-beta-D-heptose 1-phosphate adenosyltransferase